MPNTAATSTQDLFYQRNSNLSQLKSCKKRIREYSSKGNRRLVEKCRTQVAELGVQFESLHTKYISATGGNFDDPDHADYYEKYEDLLLEIENLLADFDDLCEKETIEAEKKKVTSRLDPDRLRTMNALQDLLAFDDSVGFNIISPELDNIYKILRNKK